MKTNNLTIKVGNITISGLSSEQEVASVINSITAKGKPTEAVSEHKRFPNGHNSRHWEPREDDIIEEFVRSGGRYNGASEIAHHFPKRSIPSIAYRIYFISKKLKNN